MTASLDPGQGLAARDVSRRALLGALGATALGGVAGCAEVPTSSPVQQVSPNASAPQDTGVRIDAEGPRSGASPEVIVAGFLSAMASLTPGFSVARDYLTDAAREAWNPAAGATVIESQQLTATTSSEVLTAPLVGRIDAAGRFAAASGQLRHDFGMTRVNGEWRIGRPPSGLLVSDSTMANYYSAMTRCFLAQDGSAIVSETLRVPVSRHTPTAAVVALLAGPSAWLAGQVDTALPAGTALAAPAVSVSQDGVAEVALGSDFAALPADARRRAVLQLAWTLQQFPAVDRMRVTTGGQTVVVPDLGADGPIDLTSYLPLSPVAQVAIDVIVGQRGRLAHLSTDGTPSSSLSGTLARAGAASAGVFAATGAGNRLVWVSGQDLRQAVDGRTTVLTHGPGLHQPQATSTGTIWSLQTASGHSTLRGFPAKGSEFTVPLAGLPSGTVRAVRVAPDESRVAVVVQRGSVGVLGLLALGRRTRASGPWYPLSTATSAWLRDVRDVTWTSESRLAVLAAATPGGPATVFSVSDDGAEVTPLGPVASTGVQRLVAQPATSDSLQLYALTADRTLLHCDDPWRWRTLASQVTGVALSM